MKSSKKMSGWEENSCERPTKVEENGRLVGKIKQDKEQERGNQPRKTY
ncbi:MAG: hypothetical protein ACLS6S_11545 [Lachnospira eligens]